MTDQPRGPRIIVSLGLAFLLGMVAWYGLDRAISSLWSEEPQFVVKADKLPDSIEFVDEEGNDQQLVPITIVSSHGEEDPVKVYITQDTFDSLNAAGLVARR